MPILISPQGQNVPYAGKEVPQDAAPPFQPTVNQDALYAGRTLPADADTVKVPKVDPNNDPSVVQLWNADQSRLLVTLPPDTRILTPSKKKLVKTPILDGVVVFERILREPCGVNFEFTLRMQSVNGVVYNNTNPPGVNGVATNIFPQAYLNTVYSQVFLPNTTIVVINTQLNGVGISQIIVEEFDPQPVRGSTDVKCVLKCWENVYGLQLTMLQPTNTGANGTLGVVG